MRILPLAATALALTHKALGTTNGTSTCKIAAGEDHADLKPNSWMNLFPGAGTKHDVLAPADKRGTGQALTPYSTQHGMCLDVQNAKMAPGSQVQLWQCSGGNNQAWRVEGPLFQTNNNLCLDVPGGNAYNGQKLQVWTCDGQNPNQHWSQIGNTLQWAGAGGKYCLDVTNGWFQNGNFAQLWTCYPGSANQAFTMNSAASQGTSTVSNTGSTNFYGYNCISLDAFVQKHPECAQWKGALQSAGADQGINPVFLGAIAMVESDCGAGLAGSQNAKYGPFQFMDDSSWQFFGGSNKDRTNFWDAAYGAARYFKSLIAQDNGNLYQAMRDWNGPVSQGGDPNYQQMTANYMNGNS